MHIWLNCNQPQHWVANVVHAKGRLKIHLESITQCSICCGVAYPSFQPFVPLAASAGIKSLTSQLVGQERTRISH